MLIVVRHGQTVWNAEGRLLGREDPPLDGIGLVQAERIAAVVAADRVVSSPLQRAQQTAAALGRPVEIDERWIELDYGELEGVAVGEVPASTWAEWQADLGFHPPGGETLAELGARVGAACDDLIAEAVDQDVVVVTHVSPVKAAVAWAIGVGGEVAWRTFVGPGSITRIAAGRRGAVLQSFNETGHLTI